MGQRGGSSKIQLFAESEMNFFSKVVNVQIDFDKDENDAVTTSAVIRSRLAVNSLSDLA